MAVWQLAVDVVRQPQSGELCGVGGVVKVRKQRNFYSHTVQATARRLHVRKERWRNHACDNERLNM